MSAEFMTLVQQEIPEGRQSLSDSHTNLEKVAAYCIENFARARDKREALEETKKYTTQSLASVAYQINTLAYNFLQMIEQQATQLSEMESQVNYISQMVMIHKEKVARREIGVLTTNKINPRQRKIISLKEDEKPIKYQRKPIDFDKLDNIGHGVRSTSSTTPRSRRSGSNVGGGTMAPPPPTAGPAPTTKPPTPPQPNRSVSSLSRGSREYKTPPAVAPPQVPSNYAPNYPIGHPRRNERGAGYSTLPHSSASHATHTNINTASGMNAAPGGYGAPREMGMATNDAVAHQPQGNVGMVHPMQHHAHAGHATQVHAHAHTGHAGQYTTLPANAQITHETPKYASNQNYMATPPPPSPASSGMLEHDYHSRSSGASSPPLPPPPPADAAEVSLVPASYMEKVIAVYDYTADKEDELTFSENAMIYVIKKNDDGWWEGVFEGVTGLFPGNYVEPLM